MYLSGSSDFANPPIVSLDNVWLPTDVCVWKVSIVRVGSQLQDDAALYPRTQFSNFSRMTSKCNNSKVLMYPNKDMQDLHQIGKRL